MFTAALSVANNDYLISSPLNIQITDGLQYCTREYNIQTQWIYVEPARQLCWFFNAHSGRLWMLRAPACLDVCVLIPKSSAHRIHADAYAQSLGLSCSTYGLSLSLSVLVRWMLTSLGAGFKRVLLRVTEHTDTYTHTHTHTNKSHSRTMLEFSARNQIPGPLSLCWTCSKPISGTCPNPWGVSVPCSQNYCAVQRLLFCVLIVFWTHNWQRTTVSEPAPIGWGRSASG